MRTFVAGVTLLREMLRWHQIIIQVWNRSERQLQRFVAQLAAFSLIDI